MIFFRLHRILLYENISTAAVSILMAHSAICADTDWKLVPDTTPVVKIWVDSPSAKFDGNTVTVSIKTEKSDGGGFGLVSVDCSNLTIRMLGGEIHDNNGKVISKPPDAKPTPAPTGTAEGALRRFVCDLRPAWRKLLQ